MNKQELIEKGRKMVKRFTDLGLVHHSNTLVAKVLSNHAKKVKDSEIKRIILEMAEYIEAHPEKCYPEFQEEFRAKYGRRPEVMAELLKAARPSKFLFKEFARYRKDDYKELDWEENEN